LICCVGSGEQAERRVRRNHLVLVQQRQLAVHLQHPLDHEHHVRAPGIVFIEADRCGCAQRPGQDTLLELSHLLALAQLDGVLSDQIDAADMAIQVDPDALPVQPRGDLLDMSRLPGAVVTLDHHPAVMGKTGQDRHRGVTVEPIGVVDLGNPVAGLWKTLDRHVRVDPESIANRDVLRRDFRRIHAAAISHFRNSCHLARSSGP
jgi:hypothetical protein